jgi:hypothetical protein
LKLISAQFTKQTIDEIMKELIGTFRPPLEKCSSFIPITKAASKHLCESDEFNFI